MANESTYADIATLVGNVYELALMTAQEFNVVAPLVHSFTPRSDSLPRTWATYSGGTFAQTAETDDLTAQTLTPSVAGTITPLVFAQQIFLSDKRLRNDPMGAQNEAGEYLGNLAASDVDTALVGLFTSFTGGTVGSAGGTLSFADAFLASGRLRKNKVPGPYFCVVDPMQWARMTSATTGVPTLIQVPAFAESVVGQFYSGSYAGVHYFVDANITAGTASVGAMFGRQAMFLDERQPFTIRPQYDASRSGQGGWELNASLEYAKGVFRPTYGVKMIGTSA